MHMVIKTGITITGYFWRHEGVYILQLAEKLYICRKRTMLSVVDTKPTILYYPMIYPCCRDNMYTNNSMTP